MPRNDINDWDRIAEGYNVARPQDRFFRAIQDYFWESLGDLADKRVLDLGAGDGWLAHEMQQRGATTLAVDGSDKLIELGRKSFPDIQFLQWDLTEPLPDVGPFDAVVSFMVLMDLPNLDAAISSVHRTLKPGGSFIFVVLHPCFFNFKSEFDEESLTGYRKIDRYLKPEVWRLGAFGGHNHYHRSITAYMECLRGANLVVTRFIEPTHIPEKYDCDFYRDIPVLLFVEARKWVVTQRVVESDLPR